MSEMRKGKGNPMHGKMSWNKGKKWPEMSEMRKGRGNPMYGKIPWHKGKHLLEKIRKKMSDAKKGKHYSPKTEIKRGQHLSPETEFKKGLISWNKGKSPSEEHLKNIFRAINIKPNKSELKLPSIIQHIYPNWHYVGDGKLIINGRCPDFSDGNGKLIELYGDYWHQGDNPQERIDFFREHGYDCLVIWEHELKDEEAVASKVATFSM